MTYAELDELTTTIAHLLIVGHDVGPDSTVGILMDRSHLPVIAMISILQGWRHLHAHRSKTPRTSDHRDDQQRTAFARHVPGDLPRPRCLSRPLSDATKSFTSIHC